MPRPRQHHVFFRVGRLDGFAGTRLRISIAGAHDLDAVAARAARRQPRKLQGGARATGGGAQNRPIDEQRVQP
eukprot:7957047-Pyramimonas_sp.AAC.1